MSAKRVYMLTCDACTSFVMTLCPLVDDARAEAASRGWTYIVEPPASSEQMWVPPGPRPIGRDLCPSCDDNNDDAPGKP